MLRPVRMLPGIAVILVILGWVTALSLFFSVSARADTDFLQPDAAFHAQLSEAGPGALQIQFTVAPGYYLYRERFAFATTTPGVVLGAPEYPKGELKYDPTFQKELEVYHRSMAVRIPIEHAAGPFDLQVTMQGCADKGLCYPPMHKTFHFAGAALQALGAGDAAGVTVASPSPPIAGSGWAQVLAGRDDFGQIERWLSGGSLWLTLAIFLGLGLLLTFTPCVLPMVPILSSIVVGQGARRGRALGLSTAYVLGMASVNTAIGVAAGLLGQGLTAVLQNPWVLSAFALLIAVLAGSMFGFYELQLPAALRSRIDDISRRQRGGQWGGALIMGVLSALIVSPCVTAPLAAVLAFIAKTGDAIFGGAALFAMSLGMGIPLLLVGLGAGAVLPSSGPWMESVKRFFGVVLLGVALWILRTVLPTWLSMLAWAALLLVSASYLRVFDPLPDGASGWHRLWKGFGVGLAVTAVILLIGLARGARDPLQPLAPVAAVGLAGVASENPSSSLHFERVKTVADLQHAVASAKRPVMLDFYANWCVSCKEMEKFTFSDPRIQHRLNHVLLLQADVTANDPADQALLKQFGLFGPPGILFFDASGHQIAGARVIGYQDSARFLRSLDQAFGPGSTVSSNHT